MSTPSKKAIQWARDNPEKRKLIVDRYRKSERGIYKSISAHLKRTYGISYEEYLDLYEIQGNVCAICGRSELIRDYKDNRKVRMPLFVDHNHNTGKVRGLLCSKCNTGLGMFEENINSLITAISYLKETSLA